MDYEGFKLQVYELTGVDLSMYKQNQMKRRIDSFITKCGCEGYEEYFNILQQDKTNLYDFKSYITINVTEFYRNPLQWEALINDILPNLISSGRKLKVWSAACSTGDEAYSLAIALKSVIPVGQIEIIATDIDKDILIKAKEGRYIEKNLCNIPQKYIDKYFVKEGEEYLIVEDIKKCVNFKEHNLLQDSYPSDIDLIVCRNVLIYFTEEAKRDIYGKFNKSLSENGVLFVGSTEQIIMSQEYGFESNKIFFYNKIN